jgi:periplasmic divalent cation tolerance protein
MASNKCCVVLTTTDSKKKADAIAKTLLKSKLVACIQLDEVESFFCYEEEYRQEKEFRLIIKALSDNYSAVEELIKFNHNYQLPQIIKLDITDGLPEYIDWIRGKK